MKTIRIAYIDFWQNFNPDTFIFTEILRKHYHVIFDEQNPEYIFCSNTDRNYLRYPCPRIYFSGEAVAPDFNVYDYAIGFDSLTFGDRYLCYPLCLMDSRLFQLGLHKHENAAATLAAKTGFCSFVVSAAAFDNRRDELFDLVNAYSPVASGGKHRNNLPDGKGVPDKLAFQKDYKFCLTAENSSFKGYTTEKIIDAFAACAIPIYWGDPDIKDYFNEKAFINCLDYDSDEALIARIREIHENDALYLSMLSEPMLHENSKLWSMMEDSYLEDFLLSIFEQTPTQALRRNSAYTRNGKFHEHDIVRLNRIDDNKFIKKMKDIKRSLFGVKKL